MYMLQLQNKGKTFVFEWGGGRLAPRYYDNVLIFENKRHDRKEI